MTTIRKPLVLSTSHFVADRHLCKDVEIGKTMDAVRELEKLVGLNLTSPMTESKL